MQEKDKTIYVTGGGAYKFADLISEKLNLKVSKVDEMSCICAGANFLLNNIADESFTYERQQTPQYAFQSSNPADLYPYLLVTIGSGVSVIKVTSEDSFERIGKKIFYVLFYFTFLFQSFLVRMLIVTLRLYVLKMNVSVCVFQF